MPVPVGAARVALQPLPVEEWIAGGVLTDDDGAVSSRIAIRPVGGPADWLIAHDFTRRHGTALPDDHVLGMSASTQALAGATIRREITSAFDLGTGCGVQALYASEHATHVVASDLNPRATACATLTMELNDVTNVAVREGSLFEPVEGERFDLIVANPPFVISPSRRYLFRDNELVVDDLCRQLVRSAPSHLTDGGHCQVLASWAHVRGQDWRDRLHGWFEGTECDAVVLEREMLEPGAHAASWLRQTEPPDRWASEFDGWMDYYEQHDVEAVGFGLITMRKRAAGTPWFRAEEAPHDWAMPCGDHLGATFELARFLGGTSDEQLLDVAMLIAPDVVLDERARPATDDGTDGANGWSVTDRVLRQTAGLCWEGQVDGTLAAIAAACDGTRPLGAVLADAANVADVEPSDLARAAVPVLRRLIERGFLLPAFD
jgi:Methyltransferase small domain